MSTVWPVTGTWLATSAPGERPALRLQPAQPPLAGGIRSWLRVACPELVVDGLEGGVGCEHGHDERDDLDETAQLDVVAEHEVHCFEDDELAQEQDEPYGDDANEFPDRPPSCRKVRGDRLFEAFDGIHHQFQQHRRQDRDVERVDDDRVDKLDEQVQHDDVDQHLRNPRGKARLGRADGQRFSGTRLSRHGATLIGWSARRGSSSWLTSPASSDRAGAYPSSVSRGTVSSVHA